MIPKFRAYIADLDKVYDVLSVFFLKDEDFIRVYIDKEPAGDEPNNYKVGDGYNNKLLMSSGLIDKAGVEIFENDYIKDSNKYPIDYKHELGITQSGVVEYNKKLGGWYTVKGEKKVPLQQANAKQYEVMGRFINL